MNNKIFDILVNFNGVDSITSDPIRIVQGDYNSIEFAFDLSKDDYTTALFYMIKPSGNHYAQALDSNKKVKFTLPNDFDELGDYNYSIALYDSDSRLTNAAKGKFKVVYGDFPNDDDIVSEANYPILDDLINRTSEIMEIYSDMSSSIEEYNDNAAEKTATFNNNFTNKINNINSSILEYEEETYYSPWAQSKRIEQGISNYYALTPDDKVYTVRFPLWNTSNTCNGEKLDDNIGKYITPATDTTREVNNYGPAWESVDCNAVVDTNGVRHITALKGMDGFSDTGKVDVFCLFRTYWQKIWIENGYIYFSRTFVPKDGYTIVPQAINKDGTYNSWFVIGKYVVGDIDGKLYSSKGLIPAHYISGPQGEEEVSDGVSYAGCINLMRAKGSNYYSAGLMSDYMHILTSFYIQFATKNTQTILGGNTNNNYQYAVSVAEPNVNRVILTTAQAANIDLNTYVSVGDRGTNTNNDRYYGYMHNLAYNVKVIGKEVIDSSHTALILDHTPITTTSTTYVSTMHERSGFSDYILGRTGSIGSNTNCKHGFVYNGIEISVGGYEVAGNAIANIKDSTGTREVYFTNDVTKLTTNFTTIQSNFTKSNFEMVPTRFNTWNYITEYGFDQEYGIAVPTETGVSGAGSNVGYADGFYVDAATSGQRELLWLGHMSNGTLAGLSCLHTTNSLSNAHWHFLARLSINGVG